MLDPCAAREIFFQTGRVAALAFTAALIRLYNEVWSNTAVVGGHYGPSGSPEFIGAGRIARWPPPRLRQNRIFSVSRSSNISAFPSGASKFDRIA